MAILGWVITNNSHDEYELHTLNVIPDSYSDTGRKVFFTGSYAVWNESDTIEQANREFSNWLLSQRRHIIAHGGNLTELPDQLA